MDRLGGIGIYQCSEIVPDFHSRCIVTLCSQYTLCVLRVPPWLCWTLTVLFTRQPCPADITRLVYVNDSTAGGTIRKEDEKMFD